MLMHSLYFNVHLLSLIFYVWAPALLAKHTMQYIYIFDYIRFHHVKYQYTCPYILLRLLVLHALKKAYFVLFATEDFEFPSFMG